MGRKVRQGRQGKGDKERKASPERQGGEGKRRDVTNGSIYCLSGTFI